MTVPLLLQDKYHMRHKFVLFLVGCLVIGNDVLAAEGGGSVLFVGTPEAMTAEGRAAAEKAKAELAERGITVKEIPSEDLDEAQSAALNDGGVVIKPATVNGKLEFKAYSAASGKDISKTFYAKPEPVKPQPVPVPEVKKQPVQAVAVIERPKEDVKQEEPAPRPPVRANNSGTPAGSRNHFGLSAGVSKFKKSKDTLEQLAANNPGGANRYTNISGRLQAFYERDISSDYRLGLAAGANMGGDAEYLSPAGNTLMVTPNYRSAGLYVMRMFGSHLGLYLGGGMQFYSFDVEDGGNMAGTPFSHGAFKGTSANPYAEAGLSIGGEHLMLRLSVRQLAAGDSGDITAKDGAGNKYKLVVKDGKTLGYKAAGSQLAANEKLFDVNLGGMAAGVSLAYSF